MKASITLLLMALSGLLAAQALPDTLSLQQLQNLAQQHALGVLTARADWAISALDQDIYRASMRPRLDLSANLPNYFKSFNETVQPDGTVAFRPLTINNSFAQLQVSQPIAVTGGLLFVRSNLQRFDDLENQFTSYNGIPVRVGIAQPIWAYNDWKWQRKILPAAVAERQAAYAAELREAAFAATQLFFQLLMANQERHIALTNQAAGERLYAIAQERFELGKINRGDLLQIELDLAAAAQNRLRAERALEAISADVYQLLGRPIPPERSVLVPRIPEEATHTTIDAAQALALALANRPELKSAHRTALELQRDRDRTAKTLGPQLQVSASIGLVRSDMALAPVYTDPQTEQIVSLQVQVPILDWGQRKKSIAQVDKRIALLEISNQRTQTDLENQLRLAVQQWNALDDELQLARRIRSLAEERFKISTESYILGSIPLTELTLAQQNRDQLARAYLASLQNYWLTYANIQRMTLHDFFN